MSTQSSSYQLGPIEHYDQLDQENKNSTELAKPQETAPKPAQAALKPMQDIGNCFNATSLQPHDVKTNAELPAKVEASIAGIKRAATLSAPEKTQAPSLKEMTAQTAPEEARLRTEKEKELSYLTFLSVTSTLVRTRDGIHAYMLSFSSAEHEKLFDTRNKLESFERYWSSADDHVNAVVEEYKKTKIDQGLSPEAAEEECAEVAERAKKILHMQKEKDQEALRAVMEMIEGSLYVESFFKKYFYDGPGSEILNYAQLKGIMDTVESPLKDRKFKPFFAFFPCGGEGKTWRRA